MEGTDYASVANYRNFIQKPSESTKNTVKIDKK
jgi:hypothetical protein